MNAIAAADATDSEKDRAIGDMSHLSPEQDITLTSTAGSCDDSDFWGSCD
jgi:hypothetical protein